MELKKKKNQNARSGKFISVASKDAPFAYQEAYKSLRTNLSFLRNASDVRTILITSALPDESKSTAAINLALTLAAEGHSVVLVECDLRKPVLRKYLKRELGKGGLASFLAGIAEAEDCIAELPELGICAIGAGVTPPNPAELLSSVRMRELIAMLRESFDYVLLDAPPASVVTDAAVVGRIADGAILVVRSKFASARVVRQTKTKLENVGVRLLGGVLTRFDVKKSGWLGGYDYRNYEYGYGQNRARR